MSPDEPARCRHRSAHVKFPCFQMNQLCKVCGEPAAGFHFGAFTCEGCKVRTNAIRSAIRSGLLCNGSWCSSLGDVGRCGLIGTGQDGTGTARRYGAAVRDGAVFRTTILLRRPTCDSLVWRRRRGSGRHPVTIQGTRAIALSIMHTRRPIPSRTAEVRRPAARADPYKGTSGRERCAALIQRERRPRQRHDIS